MKGDSKSHGEIDTVIDDAAIWCPISPEEYSKSELLGYDLQKKVALSIALDASAGGERRVLVFGLPGSGVGTFPNAVLGELKRKYGVTFSLFRLKCEDLVLYERKKAIDVLDRVWGWLDSEKKEHPTALFIERPEALSQRFENFYGSKGTATFWLSGFLERRFEKTLLFLTSDDPSMVELSLIRSFEIPIYMKFLDRESLIDTFKDCLGREDSSKIAGQLYKEVTGAGFKLVSAEVVKACKEVIESERFNKLRTDQAVNFIKDYIFPSYSKEYIEMYEERNKTLISLWHDHVIDYWTKRLNR
jgi:hypothetical protein